MTEPTSSLDRSLSRRDLIRGTLGVGTAGAAVGAADAVAAQDGADHTVDMTDQLVYDPADLTIAPGDTVVWENVGTVGHTVTAYEDGIPDDASFFASGGFDSEQAAREAYPGGGDIPGGESYQHTFETLGEYEYFCIPHETVGMVGTLTVTEEQGGDQEVPTFPDSALTLAIAVLTAFASTLFFAYFFLKYGGDYGTEDEE